MTISSSTYYSNNNIEQIKDQLKELMGVAPSSDWLNECYGALHHEHGRAQLVTDMVLEQILFHDLRDVIRNTTGNFDEVQHVSESIISPNAVLLREAMDGSQRDDCKRELPASFRLLVQIEEICDVSKNSEARLTNDSNASNIGTVSSDGSRTNNTTVSLTGSSIGCHKFCCVDGYYPGQSLVAIEVLSIAKPGTKVVPGTKVLLTGPITVRHGMMGWHPGNVLVLGGHVDRLIQIQQNELQKLKQMSGHGIDPTIRALIWNQQQNEDIHNEDEDENESSDVVALPRTPLIGEQLQLVQPNTGEDNPLHHTTSSAILPRQEHYRCPQQQQPLRATVSESIAIPSHPHLIPGTASLVVSHSSLTTPASCVQNRYQVPTQPRTTFQEFMPFPSSTSLPVTHVTHSASANMATDDIVARNSSQEVMTFSQLHTFLNRVLNDENDYRQHCNKSRIVGPIQQVGPKLYFNISKCIKDCNDKASPNDHKSYEYVEIAKFGQNGFESDSFGLVTCRISNAILEQCFSLSATEMKKLTRSDKSKSDILVRDGGKLVNQCLYQLGFYEVTLEQSPEKVFHSKELKLLLDGDTPIICLNKRISDYSGI